MSISQIALRRHVAQLVVTTVVLTIGCHKYTYDPHIQSVDLPPGVTSDPTQFRAQAAMRTPGATHHSSRPGKCANCLVDIEIGPLGDTREVSPTPLALLPGTGRAVAKIVNHDPAQTEEIYGFRPLLQFEYYVWADTDDSARSSRSRSTRPGPGDLSEEPAILHRPRPSPADIP